MKNAIGLFCFIVILSGCDNNTAPQAYSPEMASYSNEFDFDPVRGSVKTVTESLIDAQGKTVKYFSGKLSQEGCFTAMEMRDVAHNSGATLVLNANYYVDAATNEKRILLQGKCQLAGIPAVGVTYETNDDGFVTSVEGKNTDGKAVKTTYSYDKEGYPTGRVTRNDNDTLEVKNSSNADVRKKMDYTSQTLLNGKLIGQSVQTCDYDKHDNPQTCTFRNTDMSSTPEKVSQYTIKYAVEYY